MLHKNTGQVDCALGHNRTVSDANPLDNRAPSRRSAR